MEGSIRATEKGRWRALLSIVLAAALALCMTPVGALEAHAASKTKSYVYNYVYGTYQDEYALGFKWDTTGKVDPLKSRLKEIDVISATKGVTLRIKSSDIGQETLLYTGIDYSVVDGSRACGVIGVPAKSGEKIVYRPYTLSGKKLADTKYQRIDYFGSDGKNGGAVFSRQSGNSFVADIFNSNGKKTQTLTVAIPKGYDDFYVSTSEEKDGKIYLAIAGYGEKDFRIWYQLKNGKFVKSSAPAADNGGDDFSGIGGGVTLEHERDWGADEYTIRSYLKQPNGQRVALPLVQGDYQRYDVLEGLGVGSIDDKGVVRVYSRQGKLIKTINTGQAGAGAYWEKSEIPNLWVLVCDEEYAVYDGSLKEVTRDKSKAKWAHWATNAGKLNGKTVYYAPSGSDWDEGLLIDASLNPVRIAGCSLIIPIGGDLWSDGSTPIHTFSNGRSIVVAKNSKGKYGVLDTSGNVLIPFSYSNYYNAGGGDYIMMKASKGWQFVKVSQFASGKAVKGITYTVGKLKYKVTSTSSKNRTVTAVGHVSGTKAKGKLSIPSTVKIGGQKFKVTSVGSSAFKKSQITSVSLGSYVTTVGSNAFYGCKKLKTATLGKKVKTIGKNAFASCKKLSKITIKSKSLKSVGKGAIKGISKKAKIKVPSSKVKTYKKLFKSSTGFKKSMKVTK